MWKEKLQDKSEKIAGQVDDSSFPMEMVGILDKQLLFICFRIPGISSLPQIAASTFGNGGGTSGSSSSSGGSTGDGLLDNFVDNLAGAIAQATLGR